MLCVIPHIRKDAKDHSDSDHRKQVKKFIKNLFYLASEDEMSVTQHIFWTEYTDFDNKIGSFDVFDFPYKIHQHQMNQSCYQSQCTQSKICAELHTFRLQMLNKINF